MRGRAADNLFENEGSWADFSRRATFHWLEHLLISFAASFFDHRARACTNGETLPWSSRRVCNESEPTIDPVVLAEPHFDLNAKHSR